MCKAKHTNHRMLLVINIRKDGTIVINIGEHTSNIWSVKGDYHVFSTSSTLGMSIYSRDLRATCSYMKMIMHCSDANGYVTLHYVILIAPKYIFTTLLHDSHLQYCNSSTTLYVPRS